MTLSCFKDDYAVTSLILTNIWNYVMDLHKCLLLKIKLESLNAKSFQIWTLISGHNMQDGF